jgi:catechol 2,3-dioxygenase-like lactoylglutathione lyase family enzyme
VFDHVTIRVSDRAASEAFYNTVFATLGVETTYSDARFAEWDDFSLTATDADNPVTRGLHIGFGASSREHVDAFCRAGTEAGYRDDGAPGPRPQYRDDYYGGFLLDPDGNSVEAVHHGGIRPPGHIDHLWIRVADVPAAAAFYDLVGPYGGFRCRGDEPDLAHFVGTGGSFSLVAGTPTEDVHLAFPATENATVDAFHRAAIDAGYRDSGAPGERPRYHPGYYGAYVLDPDANNVEVVNHNRWR